MSYNPFNKDVEFDQHVSSSMKDVLQEGGASFAQLDKNLSLFVIMPREDCDNELDFFLPTRLHYGLTESGDDGKTRNTARICLEASQLGPCAICDTIRRLKALPDADSRALAERLAPRKKVYMAVWWIPVEPIFGKMKVPGIIPLIDYDGNQRSYIVSDAPTMTVLGVPNGVWKDLSSTIQVSGGIEKFLKGTPLYVVGNGKDGMARRYKEPAPLRVELDDSVLPPEDAAAPNITELVEFPDPLEVAELVDANWPGAIKDFGPYREASQPDDAPVESKEEDVEATTGFGEEDE